MPELPETGDVSKGRNTYPGGGTKTVTRPALMAALAAILWVSGASIEQYQKDCKANGSETMWLTYKYRRPSFVIAGLDPAIHASGRSVQTTGSSPVVTNQGSASKTASRSRVGARSELQNFVAGKGADPFVQA
jgi:hypothetical protein